MRDTIKCLLISINIHSVLLFFSIFEYIFLESCANASSVPVFSLKPYWDDGRIVFFSRYFNRRVFIALSNILEKTLSKDIGL